MERRILEDGELFLFYYFNFQDSKNNHIFSESCIKKYVLPEGSEGTLDSLES
jgi:hypothetical protein